MWLVLLIIIIQVRLKGELLRSKVLHGKFQNRGGRFSVERGEATLLFDFDRITPYFLTSFEKVTREAKAGSERGSGNPSYT